MIIKKPICLSTTFSAVLAIALLSAPAAHAGKVAIVGAGNLSNLSADPTSFVKSGVTITTSSSGKFGPGAGALIGFGLTDDFEFETGALYLTRKYDVKFTAVG